MGNRRLDDDASPVAARAPAARVLPVIGVAALAVVAGATCLAVGIGLAPHLVKDGLTATSVVGLLAALAGLMLLALGVRAVWRRGRLAGRLIVAPLVVVLVASAALTLGQAVAATVVPRAPLGTQSPESVGLTYEDVTALTADGVRLAGWYVPSRNGAAVVLCHGAGSTRSSVLPHAAVLASRGYGVLMVDARGHGESDGRAMDFGWYGDLDVRAAVDVLTHRPDVVDGRIAVVGLSMGGEEAIGAIGEDDRIRAVVAEGATNRVAGDKDWLSEELGVRGLLQEQLDRLTYGAVDLLTPASPPPTLRASAAAAAPSPVLLVASAESFEEVGAARFIASGSPASVTVWLAPGGHTGALEADGTEWERRVGGFLGAALAPSG
ncbi:MAG TPA: alpha/beta fold hydrolase [Humibacillus sp.]|nr:alpha/beta fold hydrolase [Humibacillus sp.]